jgi:hypothetical protein
MKKIPYFFKSHRCSRPLNENSNFNNNISRASSIASACDFTRLDEIKKYSNISTSPSSFWPSSKKSFMGKTKSFLDGTKNRVSLCFSSKNSESNMGAKLKERVTKFSQHTIFSKIFRNKRPSPSKVNKNLRLERISEILEKIEPQLEYLNNSENIAYLKSLVERILNEFENYKAEMEQFKSDLGPLFRTALTEHFNSSPIKMKNNPIKKLNSDEAVSNEYPKDHDKFVAQIVPTKISEKIKKFDNLIKQNQTSLSKLIQNSSRTNLKQNAFKNDLELVELKRSLKKQLSFQINENENEKLSNIKRPSRLLSTKDSLIVLKNNHDKQPFDNNSILSVSFSYLNQLKESNSLSSSSFNSQSPVTKSKSSNDIGLKKVSFDTDKTCLDKLNKNIFLSSKEFENICKSKYLNSENVDTFLHFLMKKLAKNREEGSMSNEIDLMSKNDLEIEKSCLESVLNQLKNIAENIECLTSNEDYLEIQKRLSLIKVASSKL